jgi:hypothetical protein
MPFEDHPLLTTPRDETVLWRYMSLTRFMNLLEHKTLWFSRLDKFENLLEGTFTDVELEHLRKLPVVPSPSGRIFDSCKLAVYRTTRSVGAR